jgi:hypothetical protein
LSQPTDNTAAARETAYRFLAPVLLSSSRRVPHSENLRRCCRQYVLNPASAAQVVDSAKRGDPFAHEMVREIAAELSRSGKSLPLAVQRYMAVDAPAFKRRRGRPSGRNWFEGIAIARAVDAVHAAGFPRSRSWSRDRSGDARLTACSIVSEVLKERFDIGKTPQAVEQDWKEYRKRAAIFFTGGIGALLAPLSVDAS